MITSFSLLVLITCVSWIQLKHLSRSPSCKALVHRRCLARAHDRKASSVYKRRAATAGGLLSTYLETHSHSLRQPLVAPMAAP